MRAAMPSLRDGVVTGIVLATAITLAFLLTDHRLMEAGQWIFWAGLALAMLSSLWTIVGYYSPPGLLGLLSGEVEIYPSAKKGSLWVDRFISARNVWLVAGLTMIVISYLPPYLGL